LLALARTGLQLCQASPIYIGALKQGKKKARKQKAWSRLQNTKNKLFLWFYLTFINREPLLHSGWFKIPIGRVYGEDSYGNLELRLPHRVPNKVILKLRDRHPEIKKGSIVVVQEGSLMRDGTFYICNEARYRLATAVEESAYVLKTTDIVLVLHDSPRKAVLVLGGWVDLSQMISREVILEEEGTISNQMYALAWLVNGTMTEGIKSEARRLEIGDFPMQYRHYRSLLQAVHLEQGSPQRQQLEQLISQYLPTARAVAPEQH